MSRWRTLLPPSSASNRPTMGMRDVIHRARIMRPSGRTTNSPDHRQPALHRSKRSLGSHPQTTFLVSPSAMTDSPAPPEVLTAEVAGNEIGLFGSEVRRKSPAQRRPVGTQLDLGAVRVRCRWMPVRVSPGQQPANRSDRPGRRGNASAAAGCFAARPRSPDSTTRQTYRTAFFISAS